MAGAELSQRARPGILAALGGERFDLLVIGGGITGAGVARAAALRGLRVALVERRDFACGTSSRSSKLIHGGVRYLEQGDFALVREAAAERRVLRRLAPYLARREELLVPVSSRRGLAKLNVGLWTYDRLAGVPAAERHRMLGKEEALAREPCLRRDQVQGAGLYYEYLTDDARLVLATVKRAAALGATVVNYAGVTGLIEEDGRIAGAEVTDALANQTLAVRARVVVNAAGPWVDEVRMLSGREKRRLHLTKGVHIVLPRARLPLAGTVVMTARDRRAVFAIPRGEIAYLGTTDTDYDGQRDDPPITAADAEYLLAAAARIFAVPPLGLEQVCGGWAGLRPLLHQEGKRPAELSRQDEIMIGPTGMISVAGGKLTTFRRMAERTMAKVAEQLKAQGTTAPGPSARSDADPLAGGETGEDVGACAARLARTWPQVPVDVRQRLAALYGSEAERMAKAIGANPDLGRRLAPGSALTRAEVEYAVSEELAATVEDVLERRARLFLHDVDNGVPAAAEVAALLGGLLGWDASRVAGEAAQYEARVRGVKAFATGGDQPSRRAHG